MKQIGPILFVRVGWLDWYDDRRDGEGPQRGGRYNEENTGSEENNHRSVAGRCYGYVQTGSLTAGINLQRLNGSRDADQVEGVTVIEVATQPGGGQVVVGVFKNATCFAEHGDRPQRVNGIYNFSAPQAECLVVPLEQRTIDVPKGRGAFGQSNVCYVDVSTSTEWVQRVLQGIDAYDDARPRAGQRRSRTPTVRSQGQGFLMEVVKRLEIERYAMDVATHYFEESGFVVTDVSQKESWDLSCVRDGKTVHVEVKGTQAVGSAVELIFTGNEIALARDSRRLTALFLVRDIQMKKQSKSRWVATGGTNSCVMDWQPIAEGLTATQYRYTFDVKRRR